jgi:hypothetical protein
MLCTHNNGKKFSVRNNLQGDFAHSMLQDCRTQLQYVACQLRLEEFAKNTACDNNAVQDNYATNVLCRTAALYTHNNLLLWHVQVP